MAADRLPMVFFGRCAFRLSFLLRPPLPGRSAAGAAASLLLLLGTCSRCVHGQVFGDGTGKLSNTSAFATFGGEKTWLLHYPDKVLGFDLGVATQPRPFLGFEFRGGAYPISARYVQMPFTGGYRIAGISMFGHPYAPFAYLGGGEARSQNKGESNYVVYPPHWEPCLQADIGFDRNFRSFGWRVAQADFRETFTQARQVRSLGLSTGIVYHFKR